MSGLGDILDALAVKLAADLKADDAVTGLAGLKACYAPDVTAEGATLYPPTIEDSPVGYVFGAGGTIQAGNWESRVHRIRFECWYSAPSDHQWALRAGTPMLERLIVAMRTGYGSALNAQRVSLVGWDEPDTEADNTRQFIVFRYELEAYELNYTTAYSPE